MLKLCKHLHSNKGDANVSKLIWIVIAFVVGASLLFVLSTAFNSENDGVVGTWLNGSIEEWFGDAELRDGSSGGSISGPSSPNPNPNPNPNPDPSEPPVGDDETNGLIILTWNDSDGTLTSSGKDYTSMFLIETLTNGYLYDVSAYISESDGSNPDESVSVLGDIKAEAKPANSAYAEGTMILETVSGVIIGVDTSGNIFITGAVKPSTGYAVYNQGTEGSLDNKIPEGAVYYVGVTEMILNPNGYADSCDNVLTAGSKFPETVSIGDVYVYEDYEYRYGYVWMEEWMPVSILEEDAGVDYPEAWAVRVINASKDKYSDMLSSVKDNPVIALIATYAFCENLTVAPTLSDNAELMLMTFAYCTSLTETPEIPKGVTNMNSAFMECGELKKASALPEGLIEMYQTFYNCAKLATVENIPSSIVVLEWAFTDCSSLVSVPDLNNCINVERMQHTFEGCSSLSVAPQLPPNVTNLYYAFRDCSNLERAPEIPDGVTDMTATFEECISLTSAPVIPSNVTSMIHTFHGCDKIKGEIKILSPNVTVANGCFDGFVNSIVCLVPDGSATHTTLQHSYTNITIETF